MADTALVTGTPAAAPNEIDSTIGLLVGNGLEALAAYDRFTQEQIDTIVAKASVAALSRHTELARLAVEETGRGLFEDKAVKNIFACEHVPHHMAGLKTVGVIARDEINGIVEIAEPVGGGVRGHAGHQPAGGARRAMHAASKVRRASTATRTGSWGSFSGGRDRNRLASGWADRAR